MATYNYKTEGNPIKLVPNDDGTFSLSVSLKEDIDISNVTVNNIEKARNKNASMYLTQEPQILDIPTYEGSGKAVHPSVLRFRTKWNGYYFWMGFTPYPSTEYENPSIVASNDGINWEVPSGLTNPIDGTPPVGYNSDTELVHLRSANKLRLYWRWYRDGEESVLWYSESSDGVNWDEKKQCTLSEYHDPLSPCIIRTDKWYMFIGTKPMRRFESEDGINWTNAIECKTNVDKVGRLWHPMVWADKNKLRMVVAISSLGDPPSYQTELFYGTSEDGENWHIEDVALWRRNPGKNFDERVYRSCVVPYGSEMFIYMSGLTSSKSERIGYAKVRFNE